MSYKDTLTLYEELIAGGCTENQAKVQAHQFGIMSTYLADAINSFKEEIVSIHKRLDKIDNDLFWMRLVGGAMTVTFLTNGLAAWFK